MTSLVLFNSERSSRADDVIRPNPDWGTGKRRTRPSSEPSSDHASGTFLYAGEPISQTYRNTDITLSNVRANDELVPAPLHTTDLTPHQIPLNFPSNHPFSSHISEKALFPNASINADDRPSTDTDPYIVTHKIRGNPFRREVHFHGLRRQSNSRWPDQQYMQLPRSVSDVGSSSIYPWPRKMFVPNETNSSQKTTYQGDYSNGEGLGSHVIYDTTARLSPNEQLKPHFKKTLDPVRPMEDMQAMHIHGNHRQASALERQRTTSMHYSPSEPIKLMSEDEKLDEQLRTGTDYVNLPSQKFPTGRAPTWISRSSSLYQPNAPRKEIRFLHHLQPSPTVPQIVRDRQLSHQQIEAENRLEQLELIRPQDNINLLNLKLRTLQHPRHDRPILPQYHDAYVNTLYDQTGAYIQERSGLYHTSTYDPNVLPQSIAELQTVQNNQDQENLLKDENNLAELLANGEQKQNQSKPKLFQYKTFADHQAMRNRLLNKFRVPQDADTVDLRVQEGSNPFIQRESVYGQSYNTRKFLQENTLVSQARSDPTCLISTPFNTNLERVRSFNSYPTKSTPPADTNHEENINDEILLGPFLPPSPYNELYATKYITEQTDGYSRRSTNRVYDSPFKSQQDMLAYKYHKKQPISVPSYPQMTSQLPNSAKVNLSLPGPEIVTRSIEPKLEGHSIYQRSYKDIAFHESISPISDSKYRSDHNRFSMRDNTQEFDRGRQWKLIDLQDRWSKTNAQRRYHVDHPEYIPYVGDGTMRAKKEILIADLIERERMMTVR